MGRERGIEPFIIIRNSQIFTIGLVQNMLCIKNQRLHNMMDQTPLRLDMRVSYFLVLYFIIIICIYHTSE